MFKTFDQVFGLNIKKKCGHTGNEHLKLRRSDKVVSKQIDAINMANIDVNDPEIEKPCRHKKHDRKSTFEYKMLRMKKQKSIANVSKIIGLLGGARHKIENQLEDLYF